ncbi:hypothetical protein V2J09_021813 [Rumex salicifolius]
MVKAYLRYEPAASFGVISSVDSNISYDSTGKFLLSPALEKIGIWHVRQGVCTKTLAPSATASGPSLAVTSIAPTSSNSVASGYADGSIRIWDLTQGTIETTLNGHKGAVTALKFNKLGSMLASGGKDNDIILWDVVGETGLFRLRGHRAQVTDLVFVDNGKKLVSSSKDKFLRVWDLDTQHCTQIISGHHSEIWSIDVDEHESFLVTGSADPELRFYLLKEEDGLILSGSKGNEIADGEVSKPQSNREVLKYFGEIKRESKDRVASLRFNKSGNLLACQMAGKMVEIFRVLDNDESKRKAKRRVHRKKEKKSSKKKADETEDDNPNKGVQEERDIVSIIVSDIFKPFHILKASKKICSISFCPTTPKGVLATLALSLNNNSVEIYSVDEKSASQANAIELPGHRSDVRSLSLNSDNSLLLSTSHNAVKIWNPSTCSCLRTIDSGYGLCSMFASGVVNSRYALVGTKEGTIEIIDVGSSTRLETVEAHGGALHSIAALPDGNGFVTGSADHDVKFWEYGQDSGCFTVSHVRTMKMNDDVLKVAVSPDAKYIAVALLDCTVKVYFLDSLKFFLSLYGHKLPVLCMDISSDGDLIVTGSADKNLKIWGLDFGDCHKSLFAHADSVMDVKFVRNTHYVFSVGKDRLVKYWDADKFELLLTLEGHHAEIWCLAVSYRGDFIVTGSHDRSLRRWDRSEESFFLEEEKEKRLEEMFEADIDGDDQHLPKGDLPQEGAVAVAGKKTKETLNATDSILDALDMAEVELKRIAEHEEEKKRGNAAAFQPNILLLGLSPSDFVLRSLSSVHTNDLEQTLLFWLFCLLLIERTVIVQALPFSDAVKLLSYLLLWTSNRDKVELICRVATVLLQTHYSQLISTPSAKPALTSLKDSLHARVKECKDTLGFNLAAMDHVKQLIRMHPSEMLNQRYLKFGQCLLSAWIREKKHKWKRRRRRSRKRKPLGMDMPGHNKDNTDQMASSNYSPKLPGLMFNTILLMFIMCSIQLASGANDSLGASFIFGDSLVDAGNNNYLSSLSKADIRPNGMDFTASGGSPTGRYTNGRTIGDIVGDELGQPIYSVPYLAPNSTGKAILYGVNYASGGGGILNATGRIFVNRLGLEMQVNFFSNTRKQFDKLLGKSKARDYIMKKSIFSITIGSNDFLNNYLLPVLSIGTRITQTPDGLIDDMISTLKSQLIRLYHLDARKFVVGNVGPIGCIPYQKTINQLNEDECVELPNKLARQYNGRLKDLLTELNENLPGSTFVYGNVYDLVLEVLTNYKQYGFTTASKACCGNGGRFAGIIPCGPTSSLCQDRNKHVFWDPYHPSEAANLLLTKQLLDGDTKYVSPMNLRQLKDL